MKRTLAALLIISIGSLLFGEMTATWTKLKDESEFPDPHYWEATGLTFSNYDPVGNVYYTGYSMQSLGVNAIWKYDLNSNEFTTYTISNYPTDGLRSIAFDSENNRLIMMDDHDQRTYTVPVNGGTLEVLGAGVNSYNMFSRNSFLNPSTNCPVIMNGYGYYSTKNYVLEYTNTWNTRIPDSTSQPWRRQKASISAGADNLEVYMFGGFSKQSGSQSGGADPGYIPVASDMGFWNWGRELWKLNLANWVWTPILGPNDPSVPCEGAICYIPTLNVFVLVGDYIYSQTWGAENTYVGGTYIFDPNDSSGFSQLSESGDVPPNRPNYTGGGLYMSLAFWDSQNERLISMRTDGIWAMTLDDTPVYNIDAIPTIGEVPLSVAFNISPNPPLDALTFWDFDNDGVTDSGEPSPTYTYTEPGLYSVKLIVQNGADIDTTLVEDIITVTMPANPRIVASPDTLRYGNVATNSTVTKPMNIYNWGGEDLEIFSISAANARYTITLPPGLSYPIVVPSLESIEIAVNFSPLAVQAYNTNLVIVSNDPNDGVLTKWLEGNGYILNAIFNATPLSGDIPLLVQFNDMSQGDILSRLWDFGDGNTSTELNPAHTYVQKGLYDVTLTVQDQYTTRSLAQQGYITAIAHPIIATPDSSGIDFGIVYLGDTGTHQLMLQSAGTDSVFVTSVGLYQPSSAYSIAPESIPERILPGMQAILDISFNPSQASTYNDTLYVYNSSENKPILKIKLRGIGEYVPPQTPQGVAIVIEGYDAVITWEAVTHNIYNTPITVPYYFIYGSLIPNPGPTEQIFIGYSTGTEFHHAGVNLPGSNVQPPAQYFYTVTAVVWYPPRNNNIALDDLIGRTKEEVARQLQQ